MPRFRRGLWPLFPITCLLFFFYYHLHATYEQNSLPLELEYLSLPEDSRVLHPGEFVDPNTHPDIQVVSAQSNRLYEPDGEATFHDEP